MGARGVPSMALLDLAGNSSAVHPNDVVTHSHGTSSEGRESREASPSPQPTPATSGLVGKGGPT